MKKISKSQLKLREDLKSVKKAIKKLSKKDEKITYSSIERESGVSRYKQKTKGSIKAVVETSLTKNIGIEVTLKNNEKLTSKEVAERIKYQTEYNKKYKKEFSKLPKATKALIESDDKAPGLSTLPSDKFKNKKNFEANLKYLKKMVKSKKNIFETRTDSDLKRFSKILKKSAFGQFNKKLVNELLDEIDTMNTSQKYEYFKSEFKVLREKYEDANQRASSFSKTKLTDDLNDLLKKAKDKKNSK